MYPIHCMFGAWDHYSNLQVFYGICNSNHIELNIVQEESEKSPALLWAASTLTTDWRLSCRQPPPFMVYYRWYWMLQQICHNTGPLGVNQKKRIAMLWGKWQKIKMPAVTKNWTLGLLWFWFIDLQYLVETRCSTRQPLSMCWVCNWGISVPPVQYI